MQSAAGAGRARAGGWQEVGRLRWLNQRVRRAGGRVPAGVLLEWDRTESWGTTATRARTNQGVSVRTKTRWIP